MARGGGVSKVLLNALHTNGGGGLVYLNGILPHLKADEWVLLVSPAALAKVMVSEGMVVKVAPRLGFFGKHLYEQLALPVLQRVWGCRAMVCNANYGPLLARKLVPIIHTTPRAAYVARGVKMRAYWFFLKVLTRLSLRRAWKALSVAAHVVPDYGGPWLAAKTTVAYPGRPAWDGAVEKRAGKVVAIGDIYAQKQYPLLVAAFARVVAERPEARLTIFGRPVDAGAVAALKRAVDAHGLAGKVVFGEGIPHGDVLNAVAGAEVLVSASKAECFNLPLLEALTVGTAVVAGDYAFQREVVGEAALLVPVEEIELAGAMLALLEDKGQRAALEQAGRVRAAGFDWWATARVIQDEVGRMK